MAAKFRALTGPICQLLHAWQIRRIAPCSFVYQKPSPLPLFLFFFRPSLPQTASSEILLCYYAIVAYLPPLRSSRLNLGLYSSLFLLPSTLIFTTRIMSSTMSCYKSSDFVSSEPDSTVSGTSVHSRDTVVSIESETQNRKQGASTILDRGEQYLWYPQWRRSNKTTDLSHTGSTVSVVSNRVNDTVVSHETETQNHNQGTSNIFERGEQSPGRYYPP